MLILRFKGEISQEDRLLQLPFDHNCLNWIVGHISAIHSHVLETAGSAHEWQEEVRRLYHQVTQPISVSLAFPMLVDFL